MISIEEYGKGGFRWTFRGAPVGKYHEKSKRLFEKEEQPLVEVRFMLPKDQAQTLCLMATEHDMRVCDLLAGMTAREIWRWQDG